MEGSTSAPTLHINLPYPPLVYHNPTCSPLDPEKTGPRSDFSDDPLYMTETISKEKETVGGVSDRIDTYSREVSESLSSRPSNLEANFRHKAAIQVASICWCFFVLGWNDGTLGPLLPTIQAHYGVGYSVVSLIFVSNCIGYIIGAVAIVLLSGNLSFGKAMVFGVVCQICAYAIQTSMPPFALFVVSYAICGFGLSFQNSLANAFLGSINESKSTKLGIAHACYGLGAFSSPLVSTQFSHLRHWTFHYLTSISMASIDLCLLMLVFRFRKQEDALLEAGQQPADVTLIPDRPYRRIVRLKVVHLMALFALIYVGVEVTLGGWIVTFIIQAREGGPSAGYISSGFFGGLTMGRIVLLPVSKLAGEHRVILLYSLLSIGLEVTIWVVPSIIENAIAVSLIGLLLGPIYPIMIGQSSHILPISLLTECLGWITGIAAAGSAVIPFFTGILASRYGITSLQPFMISMMCTLILIWMLVIACSRHVA